MRRLIMSGRTMVHYRKHQLMPELTIRPAKEEELGRAMAWRETRSEKRFDMVEYSDGGSKHAPEVISALKELCNCELQPSLLIFVHRGQQADCMMPLLPSLLYSSGYRGAAGAIRVDGATEQAERMAMIERFVHGQLLDDGYALVVEDRQERIGLPGCLIAETVELSLFRHA
ncbi:hypothetical protein GOZ89_24005 [Agrobacterium vitis]|uniref:hypothetical protein n=2 Tax=Agrobacterium vitis TaxID=373 RepID=UPI0012E76A74|nr:hypothetical protein [Agrobacterium vitis]MCF1455836.1 hypothetical protein [Agrobacterium vitis]MVA82480.1 hypothetical protein [Agrobacterium vitis]BCH56764.1 hypothetical protein RvVAR031_pl00950 [Agrobacterium vitis]